MLPLLQSGQLVVIYYLIASEILPDERGHLFGEWAYCSYRTAKDRSVCYNVDTVRLSKYYKTGTKLENLGERLYFIVEMLLWCNRQHMWVANLTNLMLKNVMFL